MEEWRIYFHILLLLYSLTIIYRQKDVFFCQLSWDWLLALLSSHFHLSREASPEMYLWCLRSLCLTSPPSSFKVLSVFMWACMYSNMCECAYLYPFTIEHMKYPDFQGEESFVKEFASWLLLVPVLAPSTPHPLALPEWVWPQFPGLCTPVLLQITWPSSTSISCCLKVWSSSQIFTSLVSNQQTSLTKNSFFSLLWKWRDQNKQFSSACAVICFWI